MQQMSMLLSFNFSLSSKILALVKPSAFHCRILRVSLVVIENSWGGWNSIWLFWSLSGDAVGGNWEDEIMHSSHCHLNLSTLEFLEKLHLAWNLLKHVKHWGGSKLLLRTSLHFPHNSLDAFASAWVLPCAIRWARLDGCWCYICGTLLVLLMVPLVLVLGWFQHRRSWEVWWSRSLRCD